MKYFRITYKYNFEDGREKVSVYLIKCLDAEESNKISYIENAFKNQCLFDLGFIPVTYSTEIIYYTLAQFNTFITGPYVEIVIDNINPGLVF